MSGEEMQEVEQFNYFGAMISTDGGIGEEIAHWVLVAFWSTVIFSNES